MPEEGVVMARTETPPITSRILASAREIARQRSAFLSEKGLSAGHDDYLLAILRNDGITMGDLSAELDISPSSATKVATRLEAMGLIVRENSRLDSRQYHAHLTEAGTLLAGEITAARLIADEALARRLKGKDAARLLKILDRLEGQGETVGKKPRKAGKKKDRKPAKKDRKKGDK